MTKKSKLKDIAIITTGKTPSKAYDDFYEDGTIPFVKPPNLNQYTKITQADEYLTEAGAKHANIVPKNSILVSCIGSLGKVGIAGVDLATNQQINSLTFNEDVVYYKYGYYCALQLQRELRNIANNAVVPIVNKTTFSKLEIPLPPLEEQKRIVKILDEADALRQKRKQAIRLLDDYLKSVFLEMFGDPEYNKKNWKIEALFNSLVSVKNGLTRRGANPKAEKDIVLRLKDIRSNFIRFSDLDRITLNETEKALFQAEQNDLLFIRVNGNPDYVGRCAVFDGYHEPVYYNDHIMRVRINTNNLNPVFLTYFLNLDFGKSEIKKHRKTSAGQYTINQEGLGSIRLYIPDISFQNKFAGTAKRVELLKQKMLNQSEKLETQFQALMQRCFGG